MALGQSDDLSQSKFDSLTALNTPTIPCPGQPLVEPWWLGNEPLTYERHWYGMNLETSTAPPLAVYPRRKSSSTENIRFSHVAFSLKKLFSRGQLYTWSSAARSFDQCIVKIHVATLTLFEWCIRNRQKSAKTWTLSALIWLVESCSPSLRQKSHLP